MEQKKPETIDAYIAQSPHDVQPALNQLRRTIAEAAPEAQEKISWGMATFTLHGNLVHFSAEKKHIGFHPDPSAIEAFAPELSVYACSKGTVRFPYGAPLPLELIGRMVRFRAEEQRRLWQEKQLGTPPALRQPRLRHPMPQDMADALEREELYEAYQARPPYQRSDYLSWITDAKRAETRARRLGRMLEELGAGDRYMGAPYGGKKPQ